MWIFEQFDSKLRFDRGVWEACIGEVEFVKTST
jgi:hypothetical protein